MVINKKQVFDLLSANADKLKNFGVERVGLFGSFVSGTINQASDVDLLVKFDNRKKTFRNFMAAAEFTENLLGRKVDFITPESLSPYLKPHIEQEVEYVPLA